jgi:two-component system response regulator FixJ
VPPDGRTVHIVDDDEAARCALSMLLGSARIPTRPYPGGHALLLALSASGKAGAGCVVMNLRMPGLDGLELLNGLRDRGIGSPAIVMAGS